MGLHYLDRLFAPRSIAVFGASERTDSVGGRVYANLREAGFDGSLYPVNPKHHRIHEVHCHKNIAAIGKPVDLAVIATPAATVPGIIEACGEQGVVAAIILSAGFSEGDGQGTGLEQKVLETAHHYRMHILGPNCLGLIRPAARLNATFSRNMAAPGGLALVSQSGALCTAILDWAEQYDIGFSAIVSLGDAADIDFGDVLDYLAQDRQTQSILLYVEGLRDAARFMSGLRVAARMKPVIALKAGRHQEGSRAAVTHSGALIGADDVFDTALQRAGAVRAHSIEQLFSAAQLLATPLRVEGRRLAIITNGGGPGVMATDRAIDLGVEIATLSPETLARLDAGLPVHWSRGNPIDVLGDAGPEHYRHALQACLDDHDIDGILVMLTPQAMTDAEGCAAAVIEAHQARRKPVLACWLGGPQVATAQQHFAEAHLPSFASPEASVEAFAFLTSYHHNQQLLMQVPTPLADRSTPDIEGARLIIESVLAEQRQVLTSTEAKAVLHAFGIEVTQSIEVNSANAALVAAESLGFPVAMKIHSRDITHKSDAGGVRLNIGNAQSVRDTYQQLLKNVQNKCPEAHLDGVTIEPMHHSDHGRELLLGIIHDPVFGPAITFGAGGIQVEVLRDRAVSLPPLNSFLAEKMISQTRIARLLGPYRDMPAVDMASLVRVLRRLSELVCELPEIRELDINPLIADEQGVMAVDARIVVARPPMSLERYGHMAIHPYPSDLVSEWQSADGTNLVIRPIRPEDAAIEARFVSGLSAQAKYFRFMRGLNELSREMLVRFTQLDYRRELALIAVQEQEGQETELGVARYAMNPDGKSCEFALVVADAWQRRGLGSHLMTALMEAARERGFTEMTGEILADNHNMLELVKGLGFMLHTSTDDAHIKVATRPL